MRTTAMMWRAIGILTLTAGITACSDTTMVKSDLGIAGAPAWVNQGSNTLKDKNGRLFHGVGLAPNLNDLSLQISTADDRARAEVAHILSSYMDVVANDYLANNGSSDSNAQAVSRQITSLSKVNLTGVKIIGHWHDPKTGVVYALAELDMNQVKATLQDVEQMNQDLKRYITTNGDNIFDKVVMQESK